jgi:uncharacterized protein (UPF0210 family)
VAVSEFFFAIDLSGAPAADLLNEVVSRILQQAGGSADGAPGTIAAVQAAVAEGGAVHQQSCRLSFVALNGHLEISVTSAAGRLWQTRHPLG